MTGRWGRRRRLLVGATVVLLVAVAVAVRLAWPTDRARYVDAGEAVQRFRESTAANADRAPTEPSPTVASLPPTTAGRTVALPPPGVYRYRTTGSESVDALGGTTHPYPGETALTVTAGGCGVQLRWDVLVERREEWRLCVSGAGIELPPIGATYHEFYGTGRLEAQACDAAVLLVPTDGRPRRPVALRCTLNDREWLPSWEVVATDVLTVEGRSIAVTHVRMTVADDDHHYEHTVVDWWLDGRGLPVAMSTTKESRSDSGIIGDVVYREQYRADLVSLTPMT